MSCPAYTRYKDPAKKVETKAKKTDPVKWKAEQKGKCVKADAKKADGEKEEKVDQAKDPKAKMTLEKCQAACKDGCTGITWDTANSKCWTTTDKTAIKGDGLVETIKCYVKDAKKTRRLLAAATYQDNYDVPDATTDCVNKDKAADVTDKLVKLDTAKTLQACADACDKDDTCKAFYFDDTKKECTPNKNDVVETKKNDKSPKKCYIKFTKTYVEDNFTVPPKASACKLATGKVFDVNKLS